MAIKRGDTTDTKKHIIEKGQESRIDRESMKAFFRIEAQKFIQNMLEEEVTELLGRKRSERK